ncbi:MAG: hypothetical protein Q7K20_05010 [Polaromonas sp.]|nr:hypothetical protein [Polaromonas sp.]
MTNDNNRSRRDERFAKRKAWFEARLKGLREKAQEYRRMNKVLRVGRTPDAQVALIAKLFPGPLNNPPPDLPP